MERRPNDASLLEVTLGLRKGWRISDRQDWAVQVEVPFRRTDFGDSGGNEIEAGLSDVRVAVGTAIHLSPTWRIGGALELRMPTGERELSSNVWRVQELLAIAWDATPWLTFSPKAEYNQTLARQHGAASQHFLELFFPATFILPDRWSITPRYETKLDFENDITTHRQAVDRKHSSSDLVWGWPSRCRWTVRTPSTTYLSITDYF